jgi:hypothetical protein
MLTRTEAAEAFFNGLRNYATFLVAIFSPPDCLFKVRFSDSGPHEILQKPVIAERYRWGEEVDDDAQTFSHCG